MDDLHIEIMITLPVDWPLSPASIEGKKSLLELENLSIKLLGLRSVGVTGSEWRVWLFQLEQALATGAGLGQGWEFTIFEKLVYAITSRTQTFGSMCCVRICHITTSLTRTLELLNRMNFFFVIL